MLSVSVIFIIQVITVCWSRSIPDATQPPTFNPRDLWDMLNTVEDEERTKEYSRFEPVSQRFGTSPSSLYLMEFYRLIGEDQLIDSTISTFSASTFEDINQLRLSRPNYQHLYRMVLSKSAIKEHYTEGTDTQLWIPIYNHELIRQINKTKNDNLRVCIAQKDKRKTQYCYFLDTTQLDLTEPNGHSWIGIDIAELTRLEMASGNDKKHLYLYFSLSGCVAVNDRCNSVSLLDDSYVQVLKLANPRVPFVIMTDVMSLT
ncbi:hypothetical protein LOD99_10100 [Oopsacas minuta]|uniref:Uncharacterized protein n=1 Tax=Oopsacas minuta TaxID=111878 RepID=A0AAV7KJU9_9METZ|nr:hypothetical protein LOD99_10100 [Oopsacas minuta]